ncbi:hypothetical protein RVS70_05730 [Virgibacillus sp. M23]|uniref:hypothetical protein n=1 Tax=Virgibacillus sp. M23 TaxID=3079030 RepID=UPI002A913EDA|nr:hypothetical protein [Virgibacillus sp. M23]MDY7043701.1 hypothetical protein [Virgibacillus sp. M23]
MDKSLQDSILKSIDILVKENIKNTKYTASNVGLVKSIAGFDCTVEIQGVELSCILFEHLHDWIQVDDIVIVQDLYNDSSKKTIVGKIGTSRPTSFTIFDTEKGRSISGVEQVYDTSNNEVVDAVLDIE